MNTKTFTKQELYAFQAELEPYRVTRKLSSGEISYIDFDTYLVDRRACVRRQGDCSPAICNIPLYEELVGKFAQMRSMLSRREYAKRKELEELEAMSN